MTTGRSRAMADRLPPVYDVAPTTLLHQVLDHLALHVTEIDEARVGVQRSHWIDTAVEREDVARLGALLDRHLESWESTELFRDQLKAIARARLAGGVAGEVLLAYVAELLAAARTRLGLRIDAAAPGRTTLVENPPRAQSMVGGPVAPLAWFTLHNHGLAPAPIEWNVVGWPGERAAVPVLVLPDGPEPQLLGWAGVIPAGRRLHVRTVDVDGTPTPRATLDGADVSARLFSSRSFAPGASLADAAITVPAEPLVLHPGEHPAWYVTAGLFDRPELDAVMFALARRTRRQGRFDESEFADAVFHRDPTVHVELRWASPEPAAFRIDVPAGVLAADPPMWPDRVEARQRLERVLDRDVAELRAAGVRSDVRFVGLHEAMALTDRASLGNRLDLTDAARTPPSPAPDVGAVLDLMPLDRSRLE